jgi:hypothetical protein
MIMCDWDAPEGHSGQCCAHLCAMDPLVAAHAPNFQHFQLAIHLDIKASLVTGSDGAKLFSTMDFCIYVCDRRSQTGKLCKF